MALVNYSDSESDSETSSRTDAPQSIHTAKPAFQAAAPGKIRVDLPSIKPEPGQSENGGIEEPPAKRVRTGGAFSGFNSLLPPPKRASQSAPKAGVSLKTSSEAAFSRNPPPKQEEELEYDIAQSVDSSTIDGKREANNSAPEPKPVGKATQFLPLSVSNKKKKKPITKSVPPAELVNPAENERGIKTTSAHVGAVKKDQEAVPKPKRSLFSMQQEIATTPPKSSTGVYEPMILQKETADVPDQVGMEASIRQSAAEPNSLETTAAELNLTAAQRRQLFGRNGGKDANVMHFNLENEYAANEQARLAGEVVEHRAVKAIAPGKHSLQQLVNNARTQQDAMEDKWAEGKRNRGEGGAKYGWSG